MLELLRREGVSRRPLLLREALRVLMQAVIEAEAATKTGASFGERSSERVTYRNGDRPGLGTPAWAPWHCRSRRCGRAATSPPCSNPVINGN